MTHGLRSRCVTTLRAKPRHRQRIVERIEDGLHGFGAGLRERDTGRWVVAGAAWVVERIVFA